MGLYKWKKLNQLLNSWPSGAVYLASWLHQQGIGYDLQRKYRTSGWLATIGTGALVRKGDRFDWVGAIHALQSQGNFSVHVGGKTALQLQGYAHFIPLGKGNGLSLYSSNKENLPKWFRTYNWGYRLEHFCTNLFGSTQIGLLEKDQGTLKIKISSPERAIMEFLYLVPQEESFEEAVLLMEGLTTLRPKITQELLELCTSTKVKRLFLYLAENCNHAWVKKLDLSKINLGVGKRQIVEGGHLNTKYNITVKVAS